MSWAGAAAAVHQAPVSGARLPAGSASGRRCGNGRPAMLVVASAHSEHAGDRSFPSSSSSSSTASAALECSLQLAAMRAAEQQQEFPLFADSFSAAALQAAMEAQQRAAAQRAEVSAEFDGPLQGAAPVAADVAAAAGTAEARREALATRFLDEQLLKAVTIVNMERDLTQEYNQVVLLGDAFDTRPFRLPWPEGTVIFCVAPAAVHAAADAAFKAQGARMPRGCLLRRVPAELGQLGADEGEGSEGSFAAALERAGFRGDRLSVWVLQGLSCLALDGPALSALFTDLCNLAAFDSLVAGLLPPMERRELDNLVASFGLLGAGVDFGAQTDWGRWEEELALDPSAERPWLFVAQQKRLSLREMGIYEDHVAAAMEVGEDFEGHFS